MLILKEIKSHGRKCSLGRRKVGGNRRPRSWTICPVCLNVFVMDRLSRRFCSYPCKVKAQSTGRRSTRKTTTKAKNAQSLLRYHVRAGNIARPTMCEECGAENRQIEGAHFNYDEPLRVRWLCISCHRKWDKRVPKQATYVVETTARELEVPARSTLYYQRVLLVKKSLPADRVVKFSLPAPETTSSPTFAPVATEGGL